jgi:uncharacterized ion transporter superfamily protein YfcC
MDPILVIGSIILLATILTWILPAGRFDRGRAASHALVADAAHNQGVRVYESRS